MTEYVVLLSADENAWEALTEAEQAAVFEQHNEFDRLLAERGHRVTGGAQLMPSTTAKVVRRDADGATTVTDGPYVETVEQLGGFYVVETDDLDDLLQVCAVLATDSDGVEVRASVPVEA